MQNGALAAAALFLVGGAGVSSANAKTYSIQITDLCDHLTIMVDSAGDAWGKSDGSDGSCDASAVAGTTGKLPAKVTPGGSVIEVGGDLGEGPTAAWSWAFNLKTGTAVLRGYDNEGFEFPMSFAFTYTNAVDVLPRNNGARSAVSLLRKK